MNNEIKRKSAFLIRLLYLTAVIGLSVFICRQGLVMMMPFVIATVAAIILQPVVRLLNGRLRMPKSLASVIAVFFFYVIIGILMLLIGVRLFDTAKNVVVTLPGTYTNVVEPALNVVSDKIREFFERVDSTTAQVVDNYLSEIGSTLRTGVLSVTSTLLRSIGNVAITVPNMLVNTLITIIATVFLTQDLKPLRHWMLMQLSEEKRTLVENIFIHLGRTLRNYVRGYGSILFITFVELSIGLWILGIGNFVLISAAIAVLDILPVVGCGTVLVPWAVILVINGNYRMAVYITVLYLVITVIRNFIEPKIVGKRVGLHPIVTLGAMVLGTKVYGGIGLLGLPIAIALLVSLNDAGAIRLFKPVPACADYDAADRPAGSGDEAPEAPKAGEAPKAARKLAAETEKTADAPAREASVAQAAPKAAQKPATETETTADAPAQGTTAVKAARQPARNAAETAKAALVKPAKAAEKAVHDTAKAVGGAAGTVAKGVARLFKKK